jgi:hypothetical protein
MPEPGSSTVPNRSLASQFFERYAADPIRGTRIQLSDIGPFERAIARIGYGLCIALVVASLFLEGIGGEGSISVQAGDSALQMQELAGYIGVLVFALGWSIILTAAMQSHRVVHSMILLVFGVLAAVSLLGKPTLQAYCSTPIVTALLIISHVVMRRLKLAQRSPAAVFGITAVFVFGQYLVLFMHELLVSLNGQGVFEFFRAYNLLLAQPLWLTSSLSIIAFSLALARKLLEQVANGRNSRSFLVIAGIAIFSHFAFYTAVYVVRLILDPSLILSITPLSTVIVSGAMLLIAGILRALGRLTPRIAALLLASSIALGIFFILMAALLKFGIDASDPLSAAIETIGILPSGAFFMFTLMLSILGNFAPFANSAGDSVPRGARVLLAVGLALSFIAMMFVFLFTANPETGVNHTSSPTIAGTSTLGAVFIGLPLLAFRVLARSDSVIGNNDMWNKRLSAAAVPNPLWAALLVGFPVLVFIASRVINAVSQ